MYYEDIQKELPEYKILNVDDKNMEMYKFCKLITTANKTTCAYFINFSIINEKIRKEIIDNLIITPLSKNSYNKKLYENLYNEIDAIILYKDNYFYSKLKEKKELKIKSAKSFFNSSESKEIDVCIICYNEYSQSIGCVTCRQCFKPICCNCLKSMIENDTTSCPFCKYNLFTQ